MLAAIIATLTSSQSSPNKKCYPHEDVVVCGTTQINDARNPRSLFTQVVLYVRGSHRTLHSCKALRHSKFICGAGLFPYSPGQKEKRGMTLFPKHLLSWRTTQLGSVAWVFVFLILPSVHAELKPRCGDCWCIIDSVTADGELGECPSDQTGILDTFPPNPYQLYESFQLTNSDAPYLTLQSADGGDCYPFADTLEPMDGYPGSYLPQCVIPENTNSTVCAFLYEPDTECQNRKYQVLTYDSPEAAELAGAVVTHDGACGVCSDARNLWGRMASIDDFETDTLICGVAYLLNQDKENRFDQLTECAMEAGLGPQCALLWAHYGATLLVQCSSACNTGTTADTNGPAPECELAECPACPKTWDGNMRLLSGRSMEGSGLSDGTAKSCSRFVQIDHDPCVGAAAGSEASSPTTTPATSDKASSAQLFGRNNVWLLAILATWYSTFSGGSIL